MSDEVKQNLKNADVWMRLLFIVILYALYGVARVVLFFIVVFQFLATLFTGSTNERLLVFGKQLAEYIYQLVQYLIYSSDDKPFPFADWPAGDESKAAKPSVAAAAPKKKAAKKKAAKPKAEPEPKPESKPEAEGGEEGEKKE